MGRVRHLISRIFLLTFSCSMTTIATTHSYANLEVESSNQISHKGESTRSTLHKSLVKPSKRFSRKICKWHVHVHEDVDQARKLDHKLSWKPREVKAGCMSNFLVVRSLGVKSWLQLEGLIEGYFLTYSKKLGASLFLSTSTYSPFYSAKIFELKSGRTRGLDAHFCWKLMILLSRRWP